MHTPHPQTVSEGDLKLVVFPGFGYRARRGWCIRVFGCVHDYGAEISMPNRLLLRMLAKAMGAREGDVNTDCFRQRVAPFVAKPARGQRVIVHVGDRRYRLRRRSRRSGYFRGRILLEAADVSRLIDAGAWSESQLQIAISLESADAPPVSSSVAVLPSRGLSIVSDIDDTIKVTEISSRRALLANTFLREFRDVEGMAERYRNWADQGANFHYVSSSPWQLYEPLADFALQKQFPPGTINLRVFRFRDEFVRRRSKTRKRKSRAIRQLLKAYPFRKFVLIGDSGERDPEIYAELARKHPEQVTAILIRELSEHPLKARRRQQLLSEYPWTQIFQSADELPTNIERWESVSGRP